jgi:hypothetical protein
MTFKMPAKLVRCASKTCTNKEPIEVPYDFMQKAYCCQECFEKRLDKPKEL